MSKYGRGNFGQRGCLSEMLGVDDDATAAVVSARHAIYKRWTLCKGVVERWIATPAVWNENPMLFIQMIRSKRSACPSLPLEKE